MIKKFNSMKTVLVTGGAGFIGTNLIKSLLKRGYKIISLDDYSTGSKNNELDNVEYIEKDIEEINSINYNSQKIDYCFHLAAQSRVQTSFINPQESIRVNVTGTVKVMEWAHKNDIKVLYAGSSSRHHDPSDSPYAMSKYIGEEICKLYRKTYSVNVEIARFYNVYGPYEPMDIKFGNVIGIWRAKIKNNQPLTIIGDGSQKRDFTHVDDIVEGVVKIIESNTTHKDAWEIGTGINYSINELYDLFDKKFSTSAVYLDDQPGNYRETLRTNDDLINLLDWHPTDRLKEYIGNLKKNK